MNTYEVILDAIYPSGKEREDIIEVEAINKSDAVSIAKSLIYSNGSSLDFYLSCNCLWSVSGVPEHA